MTLHPTASDEARQLASVRAALVHEFGDRVPAHAVQARLAATVERFDGAPIRTFVPVLAQRRVRLELRNDLASA